MPRLLSLPGALILGLVLSAAVAPHDARAQKPGSESRVRAGMDAAARGDTVQALEILDEVIGDDPGFAAAYFHRAQIYTALASGRATEFEERMEAETALEEAIRRDPGNPLYYLELGKLKLMQQIRVDSRRLFERALDAAARADATTLAEVHYQLGLFHETQWVRFKDRHMQPLGRGQVDTDQAFYSASYVWRYLESASYPGRSQGEEDRDEMLGHYRAALAAYPGHRGAASHYLAYLHDEKLYEEFLEVARRYVAAAQGDPMAYMGLGLGYYRSGQMAEAAGAFHYGLSLMSESERKEFRNLARIMSVDDEADYGELRDQARAEYERRFWAFRDPLLLSEANEFWMEFMARMTYVDFRFSIPEYRLRGWETDRGDIWLRYGDPEKVATFGAETTRYANAMSLGKVTTIWSYGPDGPVFVFRQNPGFRNARFADDFAFYAEDYRSVQPVRWESPSLPERFELPLQVVRFRGAAGAMDVEVHGAVPVGRLGEEAPVAQGTVERGLFVQDQGAREVHRLTEESVVDFRADEGRRLESWRIALQPDGQYVVGVEAREPLTWRAAVGRRLVDPKFFPAGELGLSDILVAKRVEPVRPDPELRTHFSIVANPELEFTQGEDVHIYFELYNLLPDAEQYASYELRLDIVVEEIDREGPSILRALGEVADKWGLTEEGTSPAELRFQKQARVLARDMVPEYFNVGLPGAPAGRYSLHLTVVDQNAGREATTTRHFTIRRAEDGS